MWSHVPELAVLPAKRRDLCNCFDESTNASNLTLQVASFHSRCRTPSVTEGRSEMPVVSEQFWMAGRKSLGSAKVKEWQIRFMRERQEVEDDV